MCGNKFVIYRNLNSIRKSHVRVRLNIFLILLTNTEKNTEKPSTKRKNMKCRRLRTLVKRNLFKRYRTFIKERKEIQFFRDLSRNITAPMYIILFSYMLMNCNYYHIIRYNAPLQRVGNAASRKVVLREQKLKSRLFYWKYSRTMNNFLLSSIFLWLQRF